MGRGIEPLEQRRPFRLTRPAAGDSVPAWCRDVVGWRSLAWLAYVAPYRGCRAPGPPRPVASSLSGDPSRRRCPGPIPPAVPPPTTPSRVRRRWRRSMGAGRTSPTAKSISAMREPPGTPYMKTASWISAPRPRSSGAEAGSTNRRSCPPGRWVTAVSASRSGSTITPRATGSAGSKNPVSRMPRTARNWV